MAIVDRIRAGSCSTGLDILIQHKVIRAKFCLLGALFLALLTFSACSAQTEDYSILFGGDIMLARNGNPLFTDWEKVDLSLPDRGYHVDLYAANLESPVTQDFPAISGDMNLCATQSQLSILTKSGINLVTTANNHKNDCGQNGEFQTTQLVGSESIAAVNSSMQPQIVEAKSRKIAFIAVDDVTSPVNFETLKASIRAAKGEKAFIIISIHWGIEYQAGPSIQQQDLAHAIVDSGADMIWGHHPHVLQKMEWIKSSEDGHEALVVYSMGNLLADQYMLPDAQRSALIRVSIHQERIESITIFPVMFNRQTKKLSNVVDPEIQRLILDRLGSGNIAQMKNGVQIFIPPLE